jgi:hypothetical protein
VIIVAIKLYKLQNVILKNVSGAFKGGNDISDPKTAIKKGSPFIKRALPIADKSA